MTQSGGVVREPEQPADAGILDRDAPSAEALLLARSADSLEPNEIAMAARAPLTMLGSFLRATNESTALSAAQSLVLSQLTVAPSLPITELAAADGRAVSTVTEVVNRLAAAGLVAKQNGIEDRREVRVSVTDAGRAALEGSLRLRTESLTRRMETLSGEERQALAAALPALWRLAGIDPEIWPRMHPRPRRRDRRRRPSAEQ